MSNNLTKCEFVALQSSRKKYISWVLDAEIHLDAMGLGDAIKKKNTESSQNRAKAMIFLHHHLDEVLKIEYLTTKDPLVLWNSLKERFDHLKMVILPNARYEWMHLRRGKDRNPGRGRGRGRRCDDQERNPIPSVIIHRTKREKNEKREIEIDLKTGFRRSLWSWKSRNDPAKGTFSFIFDSHGFPQPFLMNGSIERFRGGAWNGQSFANSPSLLPSPAYNYIFASDSEKIYFTYELKDSSAIGRVVMQLNGFLELSTWNNQTQNWDNFGSAPADNCDIYGQCHTYGLCNSGNSPICRCLDKFEPKDPTEWARGNWSGGCARKTTLNCQKEVKFLKYAGIKLPDTRFSWQKKKKTNKKVEDQNQQHFSEGRGMRSSEMFYINERKNDDLDLPLFDFATILDATNNFSLSNKLGEGGFGPVYKGMLKDGHEIAVKRLSRYSAQGTDEFKNEVIFIAKLQHWNLVKLLGCCIQVEEKMLVYEYMPNNSLDWFLFDTNRRSLLDWPKFFHIINGIARGLHYLHQDSRLRIIHRDLKPSNVLLDIDMNPKISDLGMARSFGGNETGAMTTRVVGTYGYMFPEYAEEGKFSVKSDVFSFGVLVLEILSGKRNRGFFHPDHHHNLLGHVWIHFKEGRVLEVINTHLKELCNLSEVQRSVHVGLLCVQQCPEDRPSMSSVVLMLSSDIPLPSPKEPGFFTSRSQFGEVNSSSSKLGEHSGNELSITLLDAR
ncbi:Receptor-like serine/threonine-protein kinase SD1-8 [Capsicum annuum]|nr:Receptor-like serine/threonine-protein kinase SD1-8 [Capsicum annuum]